LRWTKTLCTTLALLLTACEIPDLVFDNELNLTNSNFPAIIFNPSTVETSVGNSATLTIYVLEVKNLGGAHAQIEFDHMRLTITSVTAGTFFDSAQVSAPIFIHQNDGTGTLDINTFYMGPDNGVSGTGDIATISFMARVIGQTPVNFTNKTEIVDADDNPITIKSKSNGMVEAK